MKRVTHYPGFGRQWVETTKQVVTKRRGQLTGDVLYVQYTFDKAADRR